MPFYVSLLRTLNDTVLARADAGCGAVLPPRVLPGGAPAAKLDSPRGGAGRESSTLGAGRGQHVFMRPPTSCYACVAACEQGRVRRHVSGWSMSSCGVASWLSYYYRYNGGAIWYVAGTRRPWQCCPDLRSTRCTPRTGKRRTSCSWCRGRRAREAAAVKALGVSRAWHLNIEGVCMSRQVTGRGVSGSRMPYTVLRPMGQGKGRRSADQAVGPRSTTSAAFIKPNPKSYIRHGIKHAVSEQVTRATIPITLVRFTQC